MEESESLDFLSLRLLRVVSHALCVSMAITFVAGPAQRQQDKHQSQGRGTGPAGMAPTG